MADIFVSPDEQIHENNSAVLPEKEPVTEAQKSEVQGHFHSRFSAFCLYPDDIDFETKEDGERIILMLRRHPIVNIRWILISIILLTGPTFLSVFGVFSLLPSGFPLVITLAWYLFVSAYAIEGFLNWCFNVYFITTLRIVEINFSNLINKKVSDAEVTKIQDVSYTLGSFIRTMFNFGNVFIQTAADVQEFKFDSVPNPEKVAKILDDFMAKEK
jgi:hypothetical protein